MTVSAFNPTFVTFVFYLLVMLLIGWLGFRATHDLSDYILGGRRLGSLVTGLSAGASDMSGWLLMGLPGVVFVNGIRESWIAIGLVIGAWSNWYLVAPRLRLYTERADNALTLPDYLSSRFEDSSNLLRMVTSVVILVFFTIYSASGVKAGALLFESVMGISYQSALWVGAVSTIAYVFIGGFLAVSWTDTIQASMMITALLMAPIMAWQAISGDPAGAANLSFLLEGDHSNIFAHLDTIGIVSLLAWGLGYMGQPHILVRFMAAQSVQTIPNARRISMSWMILCLAGAVAIGYISTLYFSLYPEVAGPVLANSETVFMELSKQLFNPWVVGFVLAATLAAIMSTLSCQLLVCSSALTEDIYRTFLRKQASQNELVWFSRSMVLLVSLIAIGIASNPESKVLSMVSYAWAGFGAAFGPVILTSLLWRRMTRNGALAGIVAGAVTVVVWEHNNWLELYEIVPGFLSGLLAIIVISLNDQLPSTAILARHDKVRDDIARL